MVYYSKPNLNGLKHLLLTTVRKTKIMNNILSTIEKPALIWKIFNIWRKEKGDRENGHFGLRITAHIFTHKET